MKTRILGLIAFCLGVSGASILASDNPIAQTELLTLTKSALDDYSAQNPELVLKVTGFKVTTTGTDAKVLIYVDHDGMIMQGNYACIRQLDRTFVCTGH